MEQPNSDPAAIVWSDTTATATVFHLSILNCASKQSSNCASDPVIEPERRRNLRAGRGGGTWLNKSKATTYN